MKGYHVYNFYFLFFQIQHFPKEDPAPCPKTKLTFDATFIFVRDVVSFTIKVYKKYIFSVLAKKNCKKVV